MDEEVKVTDKRKFDRDGNVIDSDSSKKEKKGKKDTTEKNKTGSKEKSQKSNEFTEESQGEMDSESYPINFNTLILSLYSSAMVSLGVIPDPVSNEKHQNLKNAKEMIEVMEVLRVKTKGNLTREEDKTLEDILYQVRMIYLQITNTINIS